MGVVIEPIKHRNKTAAPISTGSAQLFVFSLISGTAALLAL